MIALSLSNAWLKMLPKIGKRVAEIVLLATYSKWVILLTALSSVLSICVSVPFATFRPPRRHRGRSTPIFLQFLPSKQLNFSSSHLCFIQALRTPIEIASVRRDWTDVWVPLLNKRTPNPIRPQRTVLHVRRATQIDFSGVAFAPKQRVLYRQSFGWPDGPRMMREGGCGPACYSRSCSFALTARYVWLASAIPNYFARWNGIILILPVSA